MIGITERGDPRFDKSWIPKLKDTDFSVIITKGLPYMIDEIVDHKEKILLHVTCTGLGGSSVEPGVPSPRSVRDAVTTLIRKGFPASQIVLRLDPIFPSTNGLQHSRRVLGLFENSGITRCRVSLVYMYNHARLRFTASNIKWPYAGTKPSAEMVRNAGEMLQSYRFEYESCASTIPGVTAVGCISQKDCDIMKCDIQLDGSSGQRPGCLCPSQKMELLTNCSQCQHKCLYCYWARDYQG